MMANISKCFDDENLERLGKVNDHLKSRLSSILERPKKIMRCSIDKSANDQWRERMREEESIGGDKLYAAKLVPYHILSLYYRFKKVCLLLAR